jgi:multicomponent Na+:H+ antiporter subunit B
MKGHPSYIFTAYVRFLFFFINLFAIYLMLRGHNLPGGGFISCLVTAISLVLLRLAVGLEELYKIMRVDPVRVAAVGLLIAMISSSVPMVFGHRFLQHFDVHLHHVPFLGDLHLGTPLVFDFGVYLVVVGVTSKIIFVLGKSTQGLLALDPQELPLYSAKGELPIEDVGETETIPAEVEKKEVDDAT